MNSAHWHGKVLGAVSIAALILLSARANAEISSYAFVQEDSSLKVAGQLVRLFGIYVPPTEHTCYTFIRPMPCGTRASLALEFKIGVEFVHCTERAKASDDSIFASCTARGEDLSAWMLQRGWAVALPDAPIEYVAMEQIARARGLGIWGIPLDIRGKKR
jgi:endonuclease YncB( thermonuclease family)